MQKKGELRTFFEINNTISTNKEKLIKAAYESYSWDKLGPAYEEMILLLAKD